MFSKPPARVIPQFDPSHKFVTSPFLSPLTLGSIRVLLGVYTLITNITILIWSADVDHDADGFFSYFTHLSYIGICAYFWASGVQTVVHARNVGRGVSGYPLQNWPRVLRYLHVLLYTTVTTFPILVTIVFWVLLSSPSTFESSYSSWSNISVHAFNTVFALFEIACTNAPTFAWIDLPVTVVILSGYLGIAYITYATQGFYSYSFLDPKAQGALLAAYIIGIALAQCLIFLIVRYAIKLRVRLSLVTGRKETGKDMQELRSETGTHESRSETGMGF